MTARAMTDRATQVKNTVGLLATLWRARLLAPMRPDRFIRMGAAMRRENMGMTAGFAAAAQRCPGRLGLIDELGGLTWRQLDDRGDALAHALQNLPMGNPDVVAIMARNHRGLVDALDWVKA